MLRPIVVSLPAVVALGIVLLPNSAISQPKSLKDQLVGTWLYTSVYDQYEDGKKNHTFGAAVKGQLMYGADGRFAQLLIGEPRPDLKTDEPRRPDAFVVAYYGTYTVNEAEKSVSYRIEGAANSLRVGANFKNALTIDGDTLKFVGSPRKDQIGTFSPHLEMRRAK